MSKMLMFWLAVAGMLLSACAIVPPAETALPRDDGWRLATPDPLPTPSSRRLQAGELVLATDRDAIPAIFANAGLFVGAEAAGTEWPDQELVIGVIAGEEARAYPVRLLSLHEIVNDDIGGHAVAVTWCPLCFTAIVFDRRVQERELTFGVSGYLYRNNLVMYDHQTNTLWSQALAQGLRGAQRGRHLQTWPSLLTTWGAWKAEHPQARILSAERLYQQTSAVIDPYAAYYTSGAAGLTGSRNADRRLPAKALVVGLIIGRSSRAYLVKHVRSAGVIADQIDAYPVLLVYDSDLQTVHIYHRQAPAHTFGRTENDRLIEDAETSSRWDIRSGQAVSGPMAGAALVRLQAPLVFWFAWSDLHPETGLYEPAQ